MKKKLDLKQFLLIVLCAIALVCTLLQFFAFYRYRFYTSFYHYDYHIFVCFALMLVSLLSLLLVTCVPHFARYRNLWPYAATVLNIPIFLCSYSFFMVRYNYDYLHYLSIPFWQIPVVLMVVAYAGCFIISMLPDRFFNKKRPSRSTVRQNSLADRQSETTICRTCGEKLQQDGVCPACCERLAFFNHMMEDMKSSTKNTPVGHNTKS